MRPEQPSQVLPQPSFASCAGRPDCPPKTWMNWNERLPPADCRCGAKAFSRPGAILDLHARHHGVQRYFARRSSCGSKAGGNRVGRQAGYMLHRSRRNSLWSRTTCCRQTSRRVGSQGVNALRGHSLRSSRAACRRFVRQTQSRLARAGIVVGRKRFVDCRHDIVS